MKQDLELRGRIKEILKLVQKVAPGNSVELRIPPYAAIQWVSGSALRRRTTPNAVEMSGHTLIELVGNPTYWEEFCIKGLVSTSDPKVNLKGLFAQVTKLGTLSKQGM